MIISYFYILVAQISLVLAQPSDVPGRTPLEFGKEISTCLSSELLWTDFDLALRDSKSSKIWPRDLSAVAGSGALEGQRIAVTYFSGWFRFTYDYLIRDVVTGTSFRYEATGRHPFVGGATVAISSSSGAESSRSLSWKGTYWIDANDRRGRNFFVDFSARFFQQLEKNVRALEKIHCQ